MSFSGSNHLGAGKLLVRGTASDNGEVAKVLVNGQPARELRPNFAEWEVPITEVSSGELKVAARAEDTAGNLEKVPHVVVVQQQ